MIYILILLTIVVIASGLLKGIFSVGAYKEFDSTLLALHFARKQREKTND